MSQDLSSPIGVIVDPMIIKQESFDASGDMSSSAENDESGSEMGSVKIEGCDDLQKKLYCIDKNSRSEMTEDDLHSLLGTESRPIDQEDYDNDIDFVLLNTKKAKSKPKPRRRTVQHEWSHEQIVHFISLVEDHRNLWDVGLEKYTMSRSDSWREVIDALACDAIDVDEAKTKWMNLRATFKRNLISLRSKKSAPGTNESTGVTWKYFNRMKFLANNDIAKSTQSESTIIDIPNATIDQSVFDNNTTSSALVSTSSIISTSQRRKKKTPTPLPPMSPTPSSSTSSGSQIVSSIMTTAAAPLSDRNDSHGVLCEYFATQLRTLPPDQANDLHFILMQAYMGFMQKLRAQRQPSPINTKSTLHEY